MEDSNKKEIPIISHLLTILSVLIGIFILLSIFKNKKEGDSKPKLKEKPQTSNSNGIVQDSVKKVVGLNKRQEEILSTAFILVFNRLTDWPADHFGGLRLRYPQGDQRPSGFGRSASWPENRRTA